MCKGKTTPVYCFYQCPVRDFCFKSEKVTEENKKKSWLEWNNSDEETEWN